MMKRILCTLAMLFLLLEASAAEPRYPSSAGVTTDAAAVLSPEMLNDLRKLDKRLEKEDAPLLRIVTVDFLDGSDVQDYADELFRRWDLEDDMLLLLLAVGEETWALSAGDDVDSLLPPATQQKLLAASFQKPYLDQRYDAALAAFVSAVVRELSKAIGESIRTDDLFKDASDSLIVNWANHLPSASSNAARETRTKADFSLVQVLVIVALLVLIFGSFRKKHPGTASAASSESRHSKAGQTIYFHPRKAPRPTPQYFKPRKPRR